MYTVLHGYTGHNAVIEVNQYIYSLYRTKITWYIMGNTVESVLLYSSDHTYRL